MIEFHHILRFIEGSMESGNFEDVVTLKYECNIPSAPVVGLKIELNDIVSFEIMSVKYIAAEEVYETFSHIDLVEVEREINDYLDKTYWVAKYVKAGFTVLSPGMMSRKQLEQAAKNVC